MSHILVPDEYPCAFCDYLAGRRPYTILHREGLAAILVTREQRGIPHLLVVTTRHAPTILDLTREESHAVSDLLQSAARVIDSAYARPGVSIWQNNGTAAHQVIPHFHFHIAGTLEGGGTNWEDVEELAMVQTERIARRLAPYLVRALNPSEDSAASE